MLMFFSTFAHCIIVIIPVVSAFTYDYVDRMSRQPTMSKFHSPSRIISVPMAAAGLFGEYDSSSSSSTSSRADNLSDASYPPTTVGKNE
jgi:hypothetical protein